MKHSLLTDEAWELIRNEAGRNCPAPAVSVLITLYNYSAYIKGCLDSVAASKTEGLPGGFEVIVVDDASTDSSVKVVADYLAASPLSICLVKKKANTGVADSRNLGLLIARAPLVFFLDADNEIRPECLLAHYHALATSDHALAYGIINRFDSVTRQSVGQMSHAEWDVRRLVSGCYIDNMAMIRKEPVLRVGGYSIEYGILLNQGWEDYDLWLKLAQAGYSGIFIPQVLTDYRVHSGSLSHRAVVWQRLASAYQSRKFFGLAQAYGDTPDLFGFSRRELALAYGQGTGLPPLIDRPVKPRLIQRLLGKKLLRSLNKRLMSIYLWLNE
ncbi:MAG: glycosyltransferase family A protein [Verrucomicrobiae bacterium]|nr:glycosyltransferase family A protein [Verrucomicrobiae bacterium]